MLDDRRELLCAAQFVADAPHSEIRTVEIFIDDVVRAPRECHQILGMRAVRGNRAAFEQIAQQMERGGKRETMGIA